MQRMSGELVHYRLHQLFSRSRAVILSPQSPEIIDKWLI